MPSFVGPGGMIRRYGVRAPLDWHRAVVQNGKIPLFFFFTGGNAIQDFANDVGVEQVFKGLNQDRWEGGDATFNGVASTVLAHPKFIAVFLDQTNPEADVGPGEGKSFNSGGLAAMSAKLWAVDDVGCVDQIVGIVIDEFDTAISWLTGGAVTAAVDRDRIFALGFSDGGFMALRLLSESVKGTLSNPFRGVYSAAGVVGGWALNHTYTNPIAYPFGNRFAESGVAITNAPDAPDPANPGPTAFGKVVFWSHGTQDDTISANKKLGHPTDSVLNPAALLDGSEANNTDVTIAWNYPRDQPYVRDGIYSAINGHSVGSSAWWSFYASANAWADGLEGVAGLFPPLAGGFLPLPTTVRQTERFGADWWVRLWSVRGQGHSWPTERLAGFEGLIVAWLFFEDAAP